MDKVFSNKLFTLVLLNTGSNDILVYPIDSFGNDPIEILVPANAGQLSEQFGWGSIAGGIEVVTSVSTSTLNVQLYSRNGPVQAIPEIVTQPLASILQVKPTKKGEFIQVKNFLVN